MDDARPVRAARGLDGASHRLGSARADDGARHDRAVERRPGPERPTDSFARGQDERHGRIRHHGLPRTHPRRDVRKLCGQRSGLPLQGSPITTVDQIIAKNPGFNVEPVREKSLHFARGYGGVGSMAGASSLEFNNGFVPIQAIDRARTLWDRLFAGMQQGTPRQLVVDRVHEHYRRLSAGIFGDGSRLSASDRARLDAHMERLLELERKLSVRTTCEPVLAPRTSMAHIDELRACNDLVAAAFICGLSNVAVITCAGEHVSDQTGWTNWHEQIAHNGGGSHNRHEPRFQEINYLAQRRFFSEVMVDLAAKLDVPEDSGTILDNSLVAWSMESGVNTHNNFMMPMVTFGSAGGFFETGRFIDFRNHDNTKLAGPDVPELLPGVLFNQWLANVLQSMGVPTETYHAEMRRSFGSAYQEGARGYGAVHYDANNFWRNADIDREVWPWRYYESADQLLPGLVKGVMA
ncbi:MAG: DUF1552 domain-containing protein [Myxococcales bacterium]|nr:DUF1552 domain-containing protein [Myxococcales bacterium]